MEAKEFLKRLTGHIITCFPDFKLFEPREFEKEFAIYANFPDQNLAIVIYPSVKKIIFNENAYCGGMIRIVLKKIKGPVFIELKNTPRNIDWRKVIADKISVLKWLISEMDSCEICGGSKIPTRNETKKTGTRFGGFYCLKCKKYSNTTYGIGLKTALHKHLK